MIFYFITAILQIALGIWTTILVVIGLSEVQKISIGYAILNMILPGLIFLVPILLLMFLVGLF